MSEPAVIEVEDLHKSFDGVHAVRGVSFSVAPGQVVGFIGANGAGKTTTMRILSTLDMPNSGRVRVDGWDVVEHPREVRRLIGWMPDSYGAYAEVSVLDYLDFYARACGLARAERVARVEEVMAFADLKELADRPMNGLSKGMAQRLCFGRALLQRPRVLILDEPAAGLDPRARIEFKNLVRILRGQKTTIFISSHILSELSEMCDTMLFIDQGRIVHHGSADSMRHREGEGFAMEIHVDGSESALVEWLRLHQGWTIVGQAQGIVRAEFSGDQREQLATELRRMIQDGLAIVDFHRQERRLEDVFVDVLKQRDSAPLIPPPLPAAALS